MSWLENLLSQGTIERLGWMLVHFLWQATVVALLLAAFQHLLRRSSANIRYLMACAALAMMVVLPVATIRLIEVPGPAAEVGPEPAMPATAAPLPPEDVVQGPDEAFTPTDVSLGIVDVTIPIPWNERIASAIEPALPYAVLGWLAGVFGLSMWHLGGWMQLQRLKRRMVHHVGAALQQQLVQVADRLGVRRAVTLLESALVEVPTVVGWLRPVILLPASALTGLSPDQLEAILAHELAHVRRYDYLVNVLQTVVEILGFYHPAVWWVSRRIRIERENCCDDMAVSVCGDSVRYARALTCLEEIRHTQADLAMAATGGSLIDRIARLLGRPAADDRRFAWLPGLITLLLIASVVIPTALALADAEARLPGPPTDDAVALIEAAQAEAEPNDPARTPVMISYTLVEVSADRTLDPQTAAEARDLLLRLPPTNSYRAIGPLPQPSLEELRRPLADALSGVMLARNKDKELVDLLVSRGYARVLSNPRIVQLPGQLGSIMIGEAQDANAPVPQGASEEDGLGSIKLETTVSLPNDPNTVVIEAKLVLTYPADDPGDPNEPMITTQTTWSLIARNNEYSAVFVRDTPQQEDEAARKRLHILLVQPTINGPGIEIDELSASEPSATEADKAHVQVGVKIVKAVDSSELDHETVLKVEEILGKRVRPEGRTGEFGPRFRLTAGEVLRNHVVGQMLPRETVDALLPLFKDVEVLASPNVVARDGMKCQMKIVTDEYAYTAPPADGSSEPRKLERIEAGTTVDMIPHVGDHNEVTMEILIEMSDLVRPSSDAGVPVVTRRSISATATVLNGHSITLGGMSEAGTPARDKDAESLYIMAMPTIVEAPADDNGVSGAIIGMGGMGGFRGPSGEASTRVFAAPVGGDPRMQYVTSDPMVQELARQVAAIEVELIRDGQTFLPEHPQMVEKRALLDAFKSRLHERRKTLEQEFEEQLAKQSKAPTNDYAQGDLKTADAPELRVTATFTNADLREVLAEIARRAGVSIVADETVQPQAIAVNLADVSVEKALLQVLSDTPYSFKRIGESSTVKKEQPRITNLFQGDELHQVLQDLATMVGVTILADETVVGPVYADMKNVSLETALEMALTGTPYIVKKTPDYYLVATDANLTGSKGRRIFEDRSSASPWPQGTYLVYRPIRMVFVGENRRQAFMDLAAMLGVSIAVDGRATGQVYADLNNVPLETAFRILTAGTPYIVEKKADHYLVTAGTRPGESKAEVGKEEQMTPLDRSNSPAWTIMRQWNCPPLLLGLTQQLAKTMQPLRKNDPVWRDVKDGGTLRLRLDVEGDVPGEVLVGLFADARWLDEPVAVRRLPGAGTHTLTGLPAGRYQIGAMIGGAPVPVALGVQRAWPAAVEIGSTYTATADVLVSEAFQKHASGWYNESASKDYLGQWDGMDRANLLQGRLTGPDGRPVRFGEILIREHRTDGRGFQAINRGTDEQGLYKFDRMAWPYRVMARRRETIPSLFAYRTQTTRLNRVLEGSQRVDFRFEPFSEGTAKVAGRVLDQAGRPVKGFFIRVLIPPLADLPPYESVDGGYATYVTYEVPFISEEGWFELSGLPAGRATVYPIPFETQRYQREEGQDVTLEAGKTAGVEVELVGKGVFYGRVLFEDGTPAVITPVPWRGATTRIFMTSGGRGLGVGQVDADGYFTIYIGDDETHELAGGDSRLAINVPTDEEGHWATVGEFPYEKLADDKSHAAVVTVKRPLPTPVLTPELRQGGPLPPGWRLDYKRTASTGRIEEVLFNAEVIASGSKDGQAAGDEEFVIYAPNGREVERFTRQSMVRLDKTGHYTLIAGRSQGPDGWRVTRGPFTLNMTETGWYKLTVLLDPSPEAGPEPEGPSGSATPSNSKAANTITARFTNPSLLEVLTEIAKRTGVKIYADNTVKPTPVTVSLVDVSAEAALRQVLEGTPYTFRRLAETRDSFQVFSLITRSFAGEDLRQALLDLSEMSQVPIVADEYVTGKVWADLKDVDLPVALEIVLAGTPYIMRATPHYYLVADRSQIRDLHKPETRQVRVNYIEPERVKPLLPEAFKPYVEPADSTDPNNHTLMITAPPVVADRIAAEIRQIDIRPRHVLLDVRIVALERRDLLNLDIEWAQEDTNDLVAGAIPESDVRAGRVPDRASWDSLLAELSLLKDDSRADIISSPQVMARDGRRSRIRVITEEYVNIDPPSMPQAIAAWDDNGRGYGIALTPHIRDDNDISLDVAYEIYDLGLRRGNSSTPVIRPDDPTNTFTVHNGGTLVLAAPETDMFNLERVPTPWSTAHTAREDEGGSERVIAFFIRPSLADDPNEGAPKPPRGTDAKVGDSVRTSRRPSGVMG